jgi:HSP20 family protein
MEAKVMPATLQVKKSKNIFEEFSGLQDRIMQRAYEIFNRDGIFGRDLDNWLQAEREMVWKPAIELEEKENQFVLRIGVPGVEPKDIDIEVTPEDIFVKAEVSHEHRETKGKVHVCEFESGNLFRAVHLPKRIDPDKVKAEFKNGMLSLTAAVAEESRAKKVDIQAA